MSEHKIRIAINAEGILCGACDQPVKWANRGGGLGQEWQHVEPDPVALAASMARHPAGKDLR